MTPLRDIRAVCFDWGDTLMVDAGPAELPMVQWPTVAAVGGARECLAALHGRLPLAIATNAGASTTQMIEQALQRVDLAQYIDAIFCYTALGYRKDQVEFWQAVQQRLQVPLPSIAMIGDSLEQDVLAPARFGVQSTWFRAAEQQDSTAIATRSVTTLPQFAEWVEAARAQ